jgi:hypothetical protein
VVALEEQEEAKGEVEMVVEKAEKKVMVVHLELVRRETVEVGMEGRSRSNCLRRYLCNTCKLHFDLAC